jgi:GT2 family glycosyltransferase
MSRTLIVIPAYVRSERDLELTRNAIDSVYATTDEDDIGLLVVDDCSPNEELAERLSEMLWRDGSYFRQDENLGFSAAVNVGLKLALKCPTEYPDVVLMNADARLYEYGWLSEFRSTDADVQGALLLYPNGLIQHAGVAFSVLQRDFEHIYKFGPGGLPEAQRERECPVTAALMYIRTDVLEDIGMFDEQFLMGWEDLDFCIRANRAGHRVLYNPRVRCVHAEQAFRGQEDDRMMERQFASWVHLWRKHTGESFADFVPTMLEEGEGWTSSKDS